MLLPTLFPSPPNCCSMKPRKSSPADKLTDPGLFVLRAGVGLSMLLCHGLPYFRNFQESAAGFYNFFGMGKELTLALTIAAEAGGSVMLILGYKARLAALILAATMSVAFFYVHGADFSGEQSGELSFIYLLCFTALSLTGPGRLSMDGD